MFVIERDFLKASAFALAGAVMTYFGFMHGEAVGIGGGLGVTPGVALAYVVMAAGLFALAKTSPRRSLQRACGSAGRGAGGMIAGGKPATRLTACSQSCAAGKRTWPGRNLHFTLHRARDASRAAVAARERNPLQSNLNNVRLVQ